MIGNTRMRGTGVASIGFRALPSLKSCAFCNLQALPALHQETSVLQHCHAIDASQFIANGQ